MAMEAPPMAGRLRNYFRPGADPDRREIDVSSALASSDAVQHIKLADFSPTPSGRNDEDGKFNATRFREQRLLPALQDDGFAELDFDGVAVCAASFLEEAFAPLVTQHGFAPEHLKTHLKVVPDKDHLHDETVELVRYFINNAAGHSTAC